VQLSSSPLIPPFSASFPPEGAAVCAVPAPDPVIPPARAGRHDRVLRRLRTLACAALLALLTACASGPSYGPAPAGYYRVQDGDTLTRVAREHGRSVADLVRWNRLSSPDQINEGQLLRVTPPRAKASAGKSKRPAASSTRPAAPAQPVRGISLVWPAPGKLAGNYNGTSSRGITITNGAGTPVVAAAGGRVEYASNGVRGYGNLVIVRHSGGFLTIYAHNSKLLVKQGQTVSQGQRIAEMGSSDAARVGLYFELRQNGRPVNPVGALPPR